MVMMSVAGIGLAALLSPLANPATWQVFSSIGNAFGVVALVALVATAAVQVPRVTPTASRAGGAA